MQGRLAVKDVAGRYAERGNIYKQHICYYRKKYLSFKTA